jgi:hypothetical protein
VWNEIEMATDIWRTQREDWVGAVIGMTMEVVIEMVV